MLEQIKKRLEDISKEVEELHPLLEELFQRHTKISRVEYTHGSDEMGADFVLTRTHDVLGTPEHIGIVAKRGKIHVKLDDVMRQIDQCTNVPRKIDGGKSEVVLSQVWVVSTGTITKGAQDRIHAKYPGTNVQFVDLNLLASMVAEYVPSYWAEVDLSLSTYLNDTKTRSEELDKGLDLFQMKGQTLYIHQDVVRVEIDPYGTEKRKKSNRPRRVDIYDEISKHRFLLIEAGMGGGKSKLLRQLTQHYADVTTFTGENILPVHVSFRELIDEYDGDLQKLLAQRVPREVQEAAEPSVEYLFLIDAIDEKDMPPDELSDALATIADVVEEDERYRLVLTSRHIGNLEFDKRFLHRLSRYELAHLSLGRIIDYLQVICQRLNLHTRIVEDLQRSALFDRLPRNPIAAVLLGQLLAENQQELPLTMTELYQKYMELALGRWDIQKGLQSQQEYETLENVLMDLAAYMLENEIEAISSTEVEDRFSRYVSDRNLKVNVNIFLERAVSRADILGRSGDGYSMWFKHRSFAEFLYAKQLLKTGKLQPSVRAFEVYWSSTYFFGLGLQKDAPELLEALISIPIESEQHRWMKLFGLADLLMAAYATPYRVIQNGVHHGALEAAKLYQDTAEGKVKSPFAELTRMQLLYFIQLVMRDNYGYEFLAPAMEEAHARLLETGEDAQTRAYAVFLLCVAYIDAGRGYSFDWLLEEFEGYLPLDLRLAVLHEGDELAARNKAMRKLRRKIDAALKDNQKLRKQRTDLYERPIALLEHESRKPSQEITDRQ